MRLGFHYHIPAVYQNNGIFMPGYLGCFIDSLAVYCEQVVCFLHSPASDELNRMDYRIVAENVVLKNIGPRSSVMERTLKSHSYTSYLRCYDRDLDIMLLRGPSPLLPAMFTASSVPTALLLVGDYLTGVEDAPQQRWRKEAIRLWAHWNAWGQDHAVRHSLTFVNSRVLFDKLKDKTHDLCEIRTTTLSVNDFFIRPNTCESIPYRFLYVGRMARAKGLMEMVEAMALLTERGEQVTLDLVGWSEPGDPVIDEIMEMAKVKNISDKIFYWGSRPFGPELFRFYKRADIFIVASYSEGFPRAIWEAMAHSLPVIATRVGSIPAFIEGAAELIQPGQTIALADAISKLIHHSELRQTLISRGLELARGNTLEIQAGRMVSKMKDWLDGRHDD